MCIYFILQCLNTYACCSESKAKSTIHFAWARSEKTNLVEYISSCCVRFLGAELSSNASCYGGTSSQALGEGENVWGHSMWPLAEAARPPLVQSQIPPPPHTQIHSKPWLLQSAETSCVLVPSIICVAIMCTFPGTGDLCAASLRIQKEVQGTEVMQKVHVSVHASHIYLSLWRCTCAFLHFFGETWTCADCERAQCVLPNLWTNLALASRILLSIKNAAVIYSGALATLQQQLQKWTIDQPFFSHVQKHLEFILIHIPHLTDFLQHLNIY